MPETAVDAAPLSTPLPRLENTSYGRASASSTLNPFVRVCRRSDKGLISAGCYIVRNVSCEVITRLF